MKKTYYFSHDYNSRNDPKLVRVLMKLGQAGKGVYWDIIEMLYEQNGYLYLCDCESIAFALRTDSECITKLINDFELFESDGTRFWSVSILERLKLQNLKSEKAKQSAEIRWQRAKDATAMRPQCDSNAIKDSKVKDIKRKESKVKDNVKGDVKTSLHSELKAIFCNKYFSLCDNEYYWSAKDGAATKQIIKKIKFKLGEDFTDGKAVEFFSAMLDNLPKWYETNFSISILNSKLNEIITEIKNNRTNGTSNSISKSYIKKLLSDQSG